MIPKKEILHSQSPDPLSPEQRNENAARSRRAVLTSAVKAAFALASSAVFPLSGYALRRPVTIGLSPSLRPSSQSGKAQAGLPGSTAAGGSLKAHAAARSLLTGCAVDESLLRYDAAYASLVREQASLVVSENAMKWDVLRPTAETYSFDRADSLVEFAEQNRIKIRGHNLLWHRSLPTWFTATATSGNASKLLEAHIATVAGRYAGRMHSWDVVNEAIDVADGRPDGLRDSPWLRLAGDGYIETAFKAARRADPQALLTCNEYGIEAEGPKDEAKRQAVLLMLRRLRARHIPIDAVGVQSHISAGAKSQYGPGLTRFMASVRELDLQIFVTEMDVNDRALAPSAEERDKAVAAAYGDYLDIVLAEPSVTAVMTWGITDRYTWLNHEDARTDGKPERPLPFDAQYKPKSAFFAMRDAIDRRRTLHAAGQSAGL